MYTQFKKHKKKLFTLCTYMTDYKEMYKRFIDEINEKQLFDFW